eukprot:SAG31_NODE_956_length_10790_cov_34.583107_10_plen_152_part_00
MEFRSSDLAGAAAAVKSRGFCIVRPLLSASEVSVLNRFCNFTRHHDPGAWGIGGPMKVQSLAQPLLDYPDELDYFARHPITTSLATTMLAPASPRFAQFDFRETPENTRGGNKWHRDLKDALCCIHYLTDVTPETAAFAVQPGTHTNNNTR